METAVTLFLQKKRKKQEKYLESHGKKSSNIHHLGPKSQSNRLQSSYFISALLPVCSLFPTSIEVMGSHQKLKDKWTNPAYIPKGQGSLDVFLHGGYSSQ